MADLHAPLVDLGMTPQETKIEPAVDLPAGAPSNRTVYPYGCCVRLEHETLEKLGLAGDLPAIGDMIHFCAEARVTSARCDPDGSAQCVELQIMRMGVPGSPDNRAERWYGDKESEDAEEDYDEAMEGYDPNREAGAKP